MPQKKRILFIHDAFPNQLSPLHEYFLESDQVESYFLTQQVSADNRQYELTYPGRVFTYQPDGYNNEHSYYYSGDVERMCRNSVNVLKAVRRFLETREIDLIVAHDRSGHPYLLFDSFDIPVVSYSEFPDFKSYGWDERYPPAPEQVHVTLIAQAMTYQSVIKSKVTIVPSEYAREMYPEPIRQKVVAQMDAFNAERRRVYIPERAAFYKEPGLTYIGFCANVLSSEKGLEYFIEISRKIAEASDKVRFVLIGSAKDGGSYGYEKQFLEKQYGKDQKTFVDYLFEKYNIDRSKYILTGLLKDEVFTSTIQHVDFFLYPLQFGAANWGFFELMIAGKVIIASDRCFIPEMIEDGVNGFMLPLTDYDAWVKLALDIVARPKHYAPIGKNAAQHSKIWHVDEVAKRYLTIFDEWVFKKPEKPKALAGKPAKKVAKPVKKAPAKKTGAKKPAKAKAKTKPKAKRKA